MLSRGCAWGSTIPVKLNVPSMHFLLPTYESCPSGMQKHVGLQACCSSANQRLLGRVARSVLGRYPERGRRNSIQAALVVHLEQLPRLLPRSE